MPSCFPSRCLLVVLLGVGATSCCQAETETNAGRYREVVLRGKPLAYWPLDETSGTVARDASAHAVHGTYHDVELGVAGVTPVRPAAEFVESHVELPPGSVFETIAGDFTIEAWVRVKSFAAGDVGCGNFTYGNDTIIAFGDPKELECGVSAPAGLLYLTIRGRTVYSSVYEPGPIDGWMHVAFARDGKRYQIYVNGRLSSEGAIAAKPITLVGSIRQIGRGLDGEKSSPLIGSLQDVAIFDSAVSPAELRERIDVAVAECEATSVWTGLGRWFERLW